MPKQQREEWYLETLQRWGVKIYKEKDTENGVMRRRTTRAGHFIGGELGFNCSYVDRFSKLFNSFFNFKFK